MNRNALIMSIMNLCFAGAIYLFLSFDSRGEGGIALAADGQLPHSFHAGKFIAKGLLRIWPLTKGVLLHHPVEHQADKLGLLKRTFVADLGRCPFT